jgi:YNFM family putative membrane transporter
VLLGGFVTVYNYIAYRLLAPPYGLSQAVVGSLFRVYVVGIVSSSWIGHLAGRLGRRKVLWTMFVTLLAGLGMTLFEPLGLIIAGIVVITFGFFGGHSIASSWVGRRSGGAKAQAAAAYLFAYYLGSSCAGAAGGLFYARHGWNGVALLVAVLFGSGLLMAWRLYHLSPLATVPSDAIESPMP